VDESLQQILALAIVGAVVVLELLRRRRSKRSGKIGCDGCDSGKKAPNQTETPIKFHKRR
jgi:hypothetical protein